MPAQAARIGSVVPAISRKTRSISIAPITAQAETVNTLWKRKTEPPITNGPNGTVSADHAPKVHASALPPRKPRNGEKACPRMGASTTGVRPHPVTSKT